MSKTPEQADRIQRHIDRIAADNEALRIAYRERYERVDELKAEIRRLRKEISEMADYVDEIRQPEDSDIGGIAGMLRCILDGEEVG
ncbi:hypothetical protein [Salibacterium aidingense]|uniref:hypothetical protein n=1 Tax=Salibacterium aidingense TaxID=384933 RepID=UPI003BD06463